MVPAGSSPDAGPVTWERWSEVAAYRVAIARMPSQHLAADHEGEVFASPNASSYPSLGPARMPPPGAVLVEKLYAPAATAPEVVFAMSRSADADRSWEFLVLDPNGTVQQRGEIEACARCHAEAPHGGLFGRAQ